MKHLYVIFKRRGACWFIGAVLFITSCEETLGPGDKLKVIKCEVPDCPPVRMSYQKVDGIPGLKIQPFLHINQFLQGRPFKAVISVSHHNKLSLYMMSAQSSSFYRIWEEDALYEYIKTNWETRPGKNKKLERDLHSDTPLSISPDGKLVSYKIHVKNPSTDEFVYMIWTSELTPGEDGWQYHLNSSYAGALGIMFDKVAWQGTRATPYLVLNRNVNNLSLNYVLPPPKEGKFFPMYKIPSSSDQTSFSSQHQYSGDSNYALTSKGTVIDLTNNPEGETYALTAGNNHPVLSRYPRDACNHDHALVINTKAEIQAGLYPASLPGYFLIVNKQKEIQWLFQPADSLENHHIFWTNQHNFIGYRAMESGWANHIAHFMPDIHVAPVHHYIIKLAPSDSTLAYSQIRSPITSGKELVWLSYKKNVSASRLAEEAARVEGVAIWIGE